MTVINKLEQACAGAKGLAADLKTFSMDTNDQNARQMFTSLAENAEHIAQMLQSRIDYIRSEEPQYCQQQ